jgi:zinc and cadmium transporter
MPGLALLIVALIGGLAMEILGDKAMRNLSVILAFGGAFIMGLIFLHLVPEAFSFSSIAGYFVLVGFVVQILLEYLSKGLEHGHVHVDSSNHKKSIALPWAAIVSLCIHAFLESMPLAEGATTVDVSHQVRSMGQSMERMHVHIHADTAVSSALFMGLALHKLPVALVLMGLIKSTGANKITRWSLLTLFGIMPGFGMYIYDTIIHSGVSIPGGVNTFMSATHGLVIGILLHVSTTVIFESGEGHAFHYKKLTATLLGLGIAFLTIG